MSNIRDDITHLQDYWQKLIAIDPDFKDILIPFDSAGMKLKKSWFKNKFSCVYEWAKSVRRTPNEWSKNAQVRAEKIIMLIDDMEKKGILQGNNDDR